MRKVVTIMLLAFLILTLVGCKKISLENSSFYSSYQKDVSKQETKPKKKKVVKHTITINGKISPDMAEEIFNKYGVIVDPAKIKTNTTSLNESNNSYLENKTNASNNIQETNTPSDQEITQIKEQTNSTSAVDQVTTSDETSSVTSIDEEEIERIEEANKTQQRADEIEEENQRHSDALDEIKSKYDGEIRYLESSIDSIRSLMSGYYDQSTLDSLYEQVAQKERKLALLQMGNGSKVEIQKLQNEISSIRQQIAKMESNKILSQEIEEYESELEQLERKMESEISYENSMHKQNLKYIENKYSY